MASNLHFSLSFIHLFPIMLKMKYISGLLLFAVITSMTLFGCKQGESATEQNPLLAPWEGAYNGLPPFDKVKVGHFKPGLEAAMQAHLSEIETITSQTAAPDFENTVAALERSGRTFIRVKAIYDVWASNLNTPDFAAIQTEMEPKIAAYVDKIYQNKALFDRVEAVYTSPALAQLSSEQQRLVWRYYSDLVEKGARVEGKNKARVAQINQELAGLFTLFNQHLLSDENDKFLELTTKEDLAGLPENVVANAATTAESKGKKGSWIIANTRSSIEPFLTFSSRRDLREKAWRMFINRGDNGDANDNNAIIPQILQLRAERAQLMGFPTHAHWKLVNKMAKKPEAAMELMEAVWKPAVARVKEEVADMQKLADKDGSGIRIEPWDYRYYAEKVRKAQYDLDQNEVKPYLQLEKMREGMFWMAGELFDMQFDQVTDVPVFHPDVRVWKVSNKKTGKQVGLWYFDPYAREGKRSGAWMTEYRGQERLNGDFTPIVSNNCNFIKGKPGEPILISWEDATTLFHEFGHALHGLCSNVTYPMLGGTNVATDYVEFPSQILERWLSTPEILNQYALHYQTGKPIPQSLLDKINRAAKFNEGFATVEAVASALVDMKIHLAGKVRIDPDAFEKQTLADLGMPAEIVMRHRLPHFGHIFADDWYSAGYYSYLWSDVISADAYEAFAEAGGPYDKAVGQRLFKEIFSVGNTVEEATAYRTFRGKDPSIDALMKNRGFPYGGASK